MRLHFALVALLALVSSCLADQEGNIADLRSDELPGIYGIQFFRDTNVSARITAFGYPAEVHHATTEDGFILTLNRIPHGKSGNTGGRRPAVLLQHGVSDSAFTWLAQGDKGSLPFVLADAGFDVWLGNSRGNQISMRHVQYTPADSQFWDWTWDELARFDLPAVTAKILEVTNSTSIGYVGHSQGCTIALAALSSNFGGIRSRINAFVGLAPVAYLANCPSPLLTGLAQLQLDTILRILGIKEFIPSGTILDKIVPGFCKLFPDACKAAICLLAGCTDNNISPAALNFAMSHFPAPTSVLNMAHWSQLLRSKQFQMFDYGSSDKNKEHYGVSTPPNYYIGNVTCGPSTKCPIGIFYGANDILADKKDVETYLIPKLQSGNGVSLAKVMLFNNYGHTDFIWGQDTSARVYTPYVATLLKQAAAAAGN